MKTSSSTPRSCCAADLGWLACACLVVCAAVAGGVFLSAAGRDADDAESLHVAAEGKEAKPLVMRKATVFSKQVAAVDKLKRSQKHNDAEPVTDRAVGPGATVADPAVHLAFESTTADPVVREQGVQGASATRFVEVPAQGRSPFGVSLEHLSHFFDVHFQCLEPFREIEPDPEIKIDRYEIRAAALPDNRF